MRRVLLILVGVIVVVGAAVGAWFFATDNAEISTDISENTDGLEAGSADEIVFRIDPEQSTAEFRIDEVLRGEDVTVVGTTQQVGGDIRVNVATPAESTIGTILVNARDLTTDADNRNRALRQFILQSSDDQYEFIEFEPTALNNMPEAVTVGETFAFEIVGNLTIVDTTNEVTFSAEVTPTSETQIEGFAETVVLYPDFNLTIPEVPFVASVEDEVTLRIDFVAVAGGDDEEATDEETEAEEPEATDEA